MYSRQLGEDAPPEQRDRPDRWLSRAEKEATLAEWDRIKSAPAPANSGGRGFPDPEIVPWCDRLNELPGICTVQSCAGHVYPDGSRTAGHIWLRLSEVVAEGFDRVGLELARMEGIEKVARVYTPWGKEVTSVTFAGNERDLLATSMGTIVQFFATLAEEAHENG